MQRKLVNLTEKPLDVLFLMIHTKPNLSLIIVIVLLLCGLNLIKF